MIGEDRQRLLYFEPDLSGGHKVVFMDHVARYAMAHSRGVEVVFAAGCSAELARLSWWGEALRSNGSNISAVQLPDRCVEACRSGRLAWRGVVQSRIASRVAAAQRADSILFGWIDQALFGIAARQVGLPCSGILFRTPQLSDSAVGAPLHGRAVRPKTMLCRAALLNPRLTHLHCLDRGFVQAFNQAHPAAARLRYLADPFVPTPLPADGPLAALRERARAQGRRIYLVIGGIDERKGVLQCLAALASLAPGDTSRVTLVIAGRVAPAFRERLITAVTTARETASGLVIEVLDRLLSDAEYRWLLDLADVVLVLYQRGHLGSSGTLVQAAAAGKPVIGTADGLVGREIVASGLGKVVDASKASRIAHILANDLDSPSFLPNNARRAFMLNRDSISFAQSLLVAPLEPLGRSAIMEKTLS